jgi:hypothetical protein
MITAVTSPEPEQPPIRVVQITTTNATAAVTQFLYSRYLLSMPNGVCSACQRSKVCGCVAGGWTVSS